jgi:hypothetical protein
MTTHTHDYSVPPGELLDALSDLSYLQARHARFAGVGEPTVEHVDDSVVVTAVRQLPMDKIPGAVKGLVGDGQITQVDTWATTPDADGTLSGSWTADLGTAPAVIGGPYQIVATDDGCTYSCGVEVKVKVPFIGGKIEEQVRGYLDRLVSKEQDFLADWLTQR